MPTLNRRVFAYLLLGTILSLVGLVGLYSLRKDQIASAYLWHVDQQIQQGRLDKAITFLQQYLAYHPHDTSKILDLIHLIEKRENRTKDQIQLLFLMEKALRLNANLEEIRHKVIDLCIRLGRYSDAMMHLEQLVEVHPEDGRLLAQMGRCELALNRVPEARILFEKALNRSPDLIRAYEQLADLYVRKQNQAEEAANLLDRMVEQNPHHAEAYRIRARFLHSSQRFDACLQDLHRWLELSPEHPEAILLMAEIWQQQGKVSQARQLLLDGLMLYERDSTFYRHLAWLEANTNRPQEALHCLRRGVRFLPQDGELTSILADLLIEHGHAEEAQKTIQQLQHLKISAGHIRYLKARLLMLQNRWSDALTSLEELRKDALASKPFTVQVLFLLAVCHERLGDSKSQMEMLQKVLTLDGDHLSARIRLAQMYDQLQKPDDSLREWTMICQSPYAQLNHFVHLIQIRLTMLQNGSSNLQNRQHLEALLDQIKRRFPTHPQVLQLGQEYQRLQQTTN